MNNSVIAANKGCFEIKLTINGEVKELSVKNGEFLLDALRRHGWKGAKKAATPAIAAPALLFLTANRSWAAWCPRLQRTAEQ